MSAIPRSLRRTALLALTPLVVGCGSDPLDPTTAAVAGRYALESYGGAPLPVVLARRAYPSTEPGGPDVFCDEQLVARTLVLGRDRRFAQVDEFRVVCDDGRPVTALSGVTEGSYSVSGSAVQLTYDPPSGAPADYLNTADATVDGASLVVTRSELRANGGTTVSLIELRYARQP